jgi:Na+-transporting NADH:ubiquinone oxidoreductase subunit C
MEWEGFMPTKIRDSLGYTIGFTFLLTFVFVFGLAFLYSSLSSTIEKNTALAQKRAVLEAMGETFDPRDAQVIESLFDQLIIRYYHKSSEAGRDSFQLLEPTASGDIPAGTNLTYYEANVQGEKVVGISFGGSGMWGTIKGVVSTNADVTRTVGIQIISHSETPGLGARITSDGFRNQFSAGVPLANGTIILVRNKVGDAPGEINAITGASVTSTSMNQLLQEAYKDLKEIVGGNHE